MMLIAPRRKISNRVKKQKSKIFGVWTPSLQASPRISPDTAFSFPSLPPTASSLHQKSLPTARPVLLWPRLRLLRLLVLSPRLRCFAGREWLAPQSRCERPYLLAKQGSTPIGLSPATRPVSVWRVFRAAA